jgi:hypothetical protein
MAFLFRNQKKKRSTIDLFSEPQSQPIDDAIAPDTRLEVLQELEQALELCMCCVVVMFRDQCQRDTQCSHCVCVCVLLSIDGI